MVQLTADLSLSFFANGFLTVQLILQIFETLFSESFTDFYRTEM